MHQGNGDRDGGHANEVGGHTCVRARPQGKMPGIAARDIDLIRMGEALRITVCRDDPQDDALAPVDESAIEMDVRRRSSEENAYKTGVAQQLLDRLLHQSRLSMQQTPLPRILHQGEPRIPQYAGHGLRKRNESGFAQGLGSGVKAAPKLGAGGLCAGAQNHVIRLGGSGRYPLRPLTETFGIASRDARHHHRQRETKWPCICIHQVNRLFAGQTAGQCMGLGSELLAPRA